MAVAEDLPSPEPLALAPVPVDAGAPSTPSRRRSCVPRPRPCRPGASTARGAVAASTPLDRRAATAAASRLRRRLRRLRQPSAAAAPAAAAAHRASRRHPSADARREAGGGRGARPEGLADDAARRARSARADAAAAPVAGRWRCCWSPRWRRSASSPSRSCGARGPPGSSRSATSGASQLDAVRGRRSRPRPTGGSTVGTPAATTRVPGQILDQEPGGRRPARGGRGPPPHRLPGRRAAHGARPGRPARSTRRPSSWRRSVWCSPSRAGSSGARPRRPARSSTSSRRARSCPKAAHVTLVVSKGPEPRTVPAGVGLARGGHRRPAGAGPGRRRPSRTTRRRCPPGQVIGTDPPAGDAGPEGLTGERRRLARAAGRSRCPTWSGRSAADASDALEAAGLVVRTDGAANRPVIATDPAAGTQLHLGDQVIIITQRT